MEMNAVQICGGILGKSILKTLRQNIVVILSLLNTNTVSTLLLPTAEIIHKKSLNFLPTSLHPG